MTAVVYDYPKSSCDCYTCDSNITPSVGVGRPTNTSVLGCQTPEFYKCGGNNASFSNSLGPNPKHGIAPINPQVLTDNRATDFTETVCKGRGCDVSYYSEDPRLIDVIRTSTLALDKPPIDGSIPLRDVNTDERLNCYGANYKGYSDINAGQVMYYIDKSIEDPFFSPVFATTAETTGYLFQDPMGAMKPHYNRTPITCDNPITRSRCKGYEGGLSWIQDSGNQREDIISKQMSFTNQQKWASRWAS
jgi:hypothetical protein